MLLAIHASLVTGTTAITTMTVVSVVGQAVQNQVKSEVRNQEISVNTKQSSSEDLYIYYNNNNCCRGK